MTTDSSPYVGRLRLQWDGRDIFADGPVTIMRVADDPCDVSVITDGARIAGDVDVDVVAEASPGGQISLKLLDEHGFARAQAQTVSVESRRGSMSIWCGGQFLGTLPRSGALRILPEINKNLAHPPADERRLPPHR